MLDALDSETRVVANAFEESMQRILTSILLAALPLAGARSGSAVGDVAWFPGSYDEALARAKAEKKLVLVDFRAEPCAPCARLVRDTYSDASVVRALGDVVCLAIDADSTAGTILAVEWRVRSEPTRIWISPDGKIRDRVDGFANAKVFGAEIERMKADRDTIGDLERRAAADAKNAELHWKLAEKLEAIGDATGVRRECEKLVQATSSDSKFRLGAAILIATEVVESKFDGRSGAFDLDALRSLVQVAEDSRDSEAVFEIRRRIAQFESLALHEIQRSSSGTAAQAAVARTRLRSAYRSAWPGCPAAELATFGAALCASFFESRGELSDEEKHFALEVAKRAADASHRQEPAALDALACALFMNDEKEDARKVEKECVALDPGDTRWTDRLEEFAN